jgi:hypothetical protein
MQLDGVQKVKLIENGYLLLFLIQISAGSLVANITMNCLLFLVWLLHFVSILSLLLLNLQLLIACPII